MTRTPTYAALALLLLACSPSAPETPSWQADVRPILAANCVRCHGYPAIGGAPTSFRLDRYEDTVTDDGEVILGAGAMAEFIAIRVLDGSMPPRFPIEDWQVETLQNWSALGSAGMPPPAGPAAPDNQAPTMRILRATQDPGDAYYTIDWEIRDPDRDIVGGQLEATGPEGDMIVTRELRAGRGTTLWDAGALPAGSYQLSATLDDGAGPVDINLTELAVENPGNNVAPRVTLAGIGRHSILADRDSPVDLLLVVEDPDTTDTLVATIVAERDGEQVVVADAVPVSPGQNTITWDTTSVPEGDGWTITATVNDGRANRSAIVSPVSVWHVTTDLGWADVETILGLKCIGCHSDMPRVPGLTWNFSGYDDTPVGEALPGDVYALRGRIYWRAVRQGTMPPRSALLLASGELLLTDAERALLTEWLRAGAPE